MSDRLFSIEEPKDDLSPALATESCASYLRRSMRPRWVFLRRTFENWFAHYPNEHRPDIHSRFHSDDNRQHYGAFFELYCHELLLRHNYEVEIHPEGDQATNAVPDFIAKRDGVAQFYLEATTAIGNVNAYHNEKRLSQLIDSLNSTPLPGYCLSFRVDNRDSTTPSARNAKAFLAKIHSELVLKAVNTRTDHTYSDGKWRIQFGFIPISQPLSRTIGMQTSEVLYDDVGIPLRRALQAKSSSKYGDLELPYVVAVNSIDTVASSHSDIEQVLIGLPRGPYGVGEWGDIGEWRKTGQSALLFAEELLPWTIFSAKPKIWIHPGAKYELSPNSFKMTRREPVTADPMRWQTVGGVSVNELLDIPGEGPPDIREIG